MNIGIFVINLISIDLFYILYKQYKKLEIKRINTYEKKMGLNDDELTSYESIISKAPNMIYSISAIVMGVYVNFINTSIYTSNSFIFMLKTSFSYIMLPLLVFLTFKVIYRYIKGFIMFFIGFKRGLKDGN